MSLMMNYHVCGVLHSESMRFNLYESHKLLLDLAFKVIPPILGRASKRTTIVKGVWRTIVLATSRT